MPRGTVDARRDAPNEATGRAVTDAARMVVDAAAEFAEVGTGVALAMLVIASDRLGSATSAMSAAEVLEVADTYWWAL